MKWSLSKCKTSIMWKLINPPVYSFIQEKNIK